MTRDQTSSKKTAAHASKTKKSTSTNRASAPKKAEGKRVERSQMDAASMGEEEQLSKANHEENVDAFLSWKLTCQSGRDFKSHSDFVCFY